MKKYILPILIIAMNAFNGFSQSANFPKADSPEYRIMKEQGTLPLNLPVDNRTDEEKTRDLKAKLAEIHKQSPNIYISGNEKIVHNGNNRRSPQPNPAGCGSWVPCGQGGGIVSDLTACDDCSSALLPLGFNFCFYGTNETQCYINNNGNLSFSAAFFNYVPVPFPNTSYDMVAPFWADVQTDCPNAGLVCSEQTATHFIVTWTAVGYFACQTNYLNTFQVIITDGTDPIVPAGNNIAVNYGQMQWTTGSASGGIGGFGGSSAIVGVNQGNGFLNSFQIGGFNAPGGTFISSASVNNQVGWLTNKTFYFNTCNAVQNIPPICSTLNNCDTVRVCGLNDTSIIDALWLSPEAGQTTWDVVNLNGLTGATILTNTSGNNANTQIQVIGSGANAGFHVISFMAYDNGSPSDTSYINETIWIDTSSVSPLNPVIGGVLALCGGDSTQLSVTPVNYDWYLWNPGGSVNQSIWVSTAGTYSVTCSLTGCQKTVSVNVQVHPIPTPTIVGPIITACGTGTTTLSSNPLYSSYLWSNGATTSSITVGGGSYTLTVTDSNGCSATTPATIVSAYPPPTIVAHNDTSFCSGTANLWVTFPPPVIPATCGLSSTGGCMGFDNSGTIGTGLQSCSDWSYPAPFGNDYTSVVSQYLYTAAELNAAGIFAGKIDQLDFDLTLIDNASWVPPITTYHNYTIQMGCTNLATFNMFPTNLETGLVTVFPSATYTVTGPTGWQTFPFTTAFNWDGTSNVLVQVCFNEYFPPLYSSTLNLQTALTPTLNYSSQEYLDFSEDACTSQTLGYFQADMMHPDIRFHYCVTPPASAFSYLWTAYPANGGVIANNTASSTTALTTLVTDYQVVVTNLNGGCSAIDTVHVGVIDIATMHITPAGPFCTASPIDTLQVSVPIGTGLFSGPGITDTNLGIFNPVIAGIGTHVIHYTVIAGPCGVGDTTITVIVSSTLNPTITQPPPVCTSYNPITLHAATAGGSWSGAGITDTILGTFNPALPGLVGNNVVTYTIYTPCYSRDTAIVHVTLQLDATIDATGGPYCVGSTPHQMTSASGPGGTWGGPGMSASGIFNPAITGGGTFTITHYLPGFCGDTATATVTVIPTPVISFVSNLPGGCEPTTITFTSTVDQPGGTYQWTFGDGNTSTAQNPANTYISFHGGIPYTVSLIYTNLTGCADTLTQNGMISIHSQPVAIFNATPQPTDITTPQIFFHDHSTGVIDNWIWSFGNGTGSIIQNPSCTYADTGNYTVRLVVNNTWCQDTAWEHIIIDPILTCYIPNAFTPDGNGDNDMFMISGTDILKDDFTMLIFDRWGEMLFKTTDLHEGWNGSKGNSGAPCEMGVYVYKINLRDWKGLAHEYIGHVTLIK